MVACRQLYKTAKANKRHEILTIGGPCLLSVSSVQSSKSTAKIPASTACLHVCDSLYIPQCE